MDRRHRVVNITIAWDGRQPICVEFFRSSDPRTVLLMFPMRPMGSLWWPVGDNAIVVPAGSRLEWRAHTNEHMNPMVQIVSQDDAGQHWADFVMPFALDEQRTPTADEVAYWDRYFDEEEAAERRALTEAWR